VHVYTSGMTYPYYKNKNTVIPSYKKKHQSDLLN